MNILEKIKTKFLKRKRKIKGKVLQLNPDTYWLGILYGMFSLFVLSCLFGYYLFMKTNEEPIPAQIKSLQAEKISKERIDKVLDYFKKREEKSNQIINSPAPIVDPSM